MSLEIRHHGVVKNGRLSFYEPEVYNKVVESLNGKEFTLTLKKRHRQISPNKHAYYRGGILNVLYQTEMFSHLDNKDQIHELYIAKRFLSYVKPIFIGGIRSEEVGVKSLSDLSDDEMGEFIERVRAHCETELSVEILDPEMYYSKYYNK